MQTIHSLCQARNPLELLCARIFCRRTTWTWTWSRPHELSFGVTKVYTIEDSRHALLHHACCGWILTATDKIGKVAKPRAKAVAAAETTPTKTKVLDPHHVSVTFPLLHEVGSTHDNTETNISPKEKQLRVNPIHDPGRLVDGSNKSYTCVADPTGLMVPPLGPASEMTVSSGIPRNISLNQSPQPPFAGF